MRLPAHPPTRLRLTPPRPARTWPDGPLWRRWDRFLIRGHLDTIDHLTRRIGELDLRIEVVVRPLEAAIELLQTIAGVRRRSAEAIVAEIGKDMSQFPTPEQFASCARLCPGNHESVGKRRATGTGRGNTWLRRTALSPVAWAAVRSTGS